MASKIKLLGSFAAMAANSAVKAQNQEFMRGFYTGFFLSTEDQFEDYSCPVAEINHMVWIYTDMLLPMAKKLLANINEGEPSPNFDLVLNTASYIVNKFSILDDVIDFVFGTNPLIDLVFNSAIFLTKIQAIINPMIDLAAENATSLANIYSTFDNNYDGGMFCRGLLFSKETAKVVFAIGNEIKEKVNTPSIKTDSSLSTHMNSTSINNSKKLQKKVHLLHPEVGKECVRRTRVLGHKGGFFGPGNTLKDFQGSIDNGLEGVEFDVWLSKDGVPMVVHKRGALVDYGLPKQFIWQMTSEQLRYVNAGDYQQIPTLESVIKLFENSPNLLLNIELKAPVGQYTSHQKYNTRLAAQKVIELVEKYDIGYKVIIESFNRKMLKDIIAVSNPETRSYLIVECVPINQTKRNPYSYATMPGTQAHLIHIDFLTEKRFKQVKFAQKKLIAAWYYQEAYDPAPWSREGPEMWSKVFTFNGGVDLRNQNKCPLGIGIDFFTSDRPLEAMQFRDNLLSGFGWDEKTPSISPLTSP